MDFLEYYEEKGCVLQTEYGMRINRLKSTNEEMRQKGRRVGGATLVEGDNGGKSIDTVAKEAPGHISETKEPIWCKTHKRVRRALFAHGFSSRGNIY